TMRDDSPGPALLVPDGGVRPHRPADGDTERREAAQVPQVGRQPGAGQDLVVADRLVEGDGLGLVQLAERAGGAGQAAGAHERDVAPLRGDVVAEAAQPPAHVAGAELDLHARRRPLVGPLLADRLERAVRSRPRREPLLADDHPALTSLGRTAAPGAEAAAQARRG